MTVSREAIVQTKDYIEDMSRCPHELLDVLGTFAVEDRSERPYKAQTKESIDLINRTKPERYAHIAILMDGLLEEFHSNRDGRGEFGMLVPEGKFSNQWQYLRKAFRYTIKKDIETLEDRPLYLDALRQNQIVNRLDVRRERSINQLLENGARTASDIIFGLLKDLPVIINHFDPSVSKSDWHAIARNSINLPTRLARQSDLDLVCIRNTLEKKPVKSDSYEFNAKHFEPVRVGNRLVAIKFTDLDELLDSVNDNIRYFKMPEVPPMPTKPDMTEDDDPIVIGCPILLLPGRLKELWQWGIDTVEKNNLWKYEK